MPKWTDDDDDIAPLPTQLAEVSELEPALRAAESIPPPNRLAEQPSPSTGPAASEPSRENPSSPKDSSGVIVEQPNVEGREELGHGATRIGILGGREVGKSYLFQGLVHSLIDSAATGNGVLGRYLRGRAPEIWHSYAMRGQKMTPLNTNTFAEEYRRWRRLPSTQREDQRWYKLRMSFRTGLTGRKPWKLDVDFLDGSGDALELGLVPFMVPLWKRAFEAATIMVFCLPFWVLFPDGGVMSEEDIRQRERILGRFGNLVNAYKEIRDSSLRVHTFLGLTMADDKRGSLEILRRRLIDPCTGDGRNKYLKKLGGMQGVPRYLASAREVSKYLYKEIRYSEDSRVKEIPGMLTFEDPPWLFAVSAINGDRLSEIEAQRRAGLAGNERGEPRPAHVELPLLAAMCDCNNALM